MQRVIVEMGMGVDLHGRDHHKAAMRAVQSLLQNASLPVLRHYAEDEIAVRVTVGVQAPDAVDRAAIAALFPRGQVTVSVVPGGMDVVYPDTADTHVTASVAAEVFLPRAPQAVPRR